VVSVDDPQFDPKMPLQLNGPGNTPTMAIPLSSPALNKADAATSLPNDQRGVPRPEFGGFSIGAYEPCRNHLGLTVCPAQIAQSAALTMQVSPAGAGSTSPPVGTNNELLGSVTPIMATPSPRFAFLNWTGALAGTIGDPNNASTTVIMNQDQKVTANFVPVQPCTVTFTPTDTPFGQPPRNLPLTLSICQTNPQTGACINPTTPGPSTTVTVAQNQSVVLSTFVQGQDMPIPYDPANRRIFVLASQSGNPVGGTSVAVKMLGGSAGVQSALANPATTIVSSILPNTRTTSPGTPVTAFATIINAGAATATACSIALPSGIPATLLYQTTDPHTNMPVGTANTPADIPAGQAQTFYFAITPSSPFTQDIALVFTCTNTNPAPVIEGVNTFLLTSSTTPIADMISIASTITNDGNVVLMGPTGIGAIATAALNLRACP
jgi:hypothetical protein